MKIDCYMTNRQMLDVYLNNKMRIKKLVAKSKLLNTNDDLIDENAGKIIKLIIENDQIEECQAYLFYNEILEEVKRKQRVLLTSYLERIRVMRFDQDKIMKKIRSKINNSNVVEFLSDNDHIIVKDFNELVR